MGFFTHRPFGRAAALTLAAAMLLGTPSALAAQVPVELLGQENSISAPGVALVVAVVGDEAHLVLPEKCLEPTGQCGLAASGAACDADDQIVHVPKTSACRLL